MKDCISLLNSTLSLILFLLVGSGFYSCGEDSPGWEPPYDPDQDNPYLEPISDEDLMDFVQERTLAYFWDYAEKNSGAARERYHVDDPSLNEHVVTTGGSGFGIMAIIAGIDRGFIGRGEAVTRLTKIINFFESADRFHGAWSHWIDGRNGSVIPFSTKDNGGDLVETAFLAQGLICIYEYFKNGSQTEKELANKAKTLWEGIEWDWYTQGGQNVLYWHWSPDHGFDIGLRLTGYNETLIAYVLAAASPTFLIEKSVYDGGWARNGDIVSSESQYNLPLLLDHNGSGTGPLFWAHYSYLGLDPKGLSDSYCPDYWLLNKNHTLINYEYCVKNPRNHKQYGPRCWGLTASYTRNSDGTTGYSAHDPQNDPGVISPTAAISSLPYTPEQSLEAMHYFYENGKTLIGPAGFYDAFAPDYDWVTKRYLAIDQGPQIVMVENHRSGLLWKLFMQNEDVLNGLERLGFTVSLVHH